MSAVNLNVEEGNRERDACGVGFVYRPQASHTVLRECLTALCRLEHRGACSSDGDTGDGAGILSPIPWALFRKQDFVDDVSDYAVGVVFLPSGFEHQCRLALESFLEDEGFAHWTWRTVPVRTEVLGAAARSSCPNIEHLFLRMPDGGTEKIGEQKLMSVRKRAINFVRHTLSLSDFYICSLSTKTIVYKGMVRAQALAEFYPELKDPDYQVNWAIFHRRFSTNTFPKWALAQPFRMMAHNGEINTLLGNRTWMRAREHILTDSIWNGKRHQQQPIISTVGSDSGNFDNVLEMLVCAGHSPEAALMQLIPEAYRHQPQLNGDPNIAAFYEYYSALQEPWDGPALIIYSDGKRLGAVLDRNGLRPARYTVCRDGCVILASEVGVVDIAPEDVVYKGRLGPGEMLSIDLESGKLQNNLEIKRQVARLHPYASWLRSGRCWLEEASFQAHPVLSRLQALTMQQAFGYSKEEIEPVLESMILTGTEHVFSMGDDTPLAVLSEQPRVLSDYFRQKFAQVTNPPVDPIRERLVMSLDTYLGSRPDTLHPGPQAARMLHLTSPFLNENELENLRELSAEFGVQVINAHFDAESADLSIALSALCFEAEQAALGGKSVIILTDRGVSAGTAAIPMLLAVSAVHHHLMRQRLRLRTSLVIETGQSWTTHQFACLLGFGAQAICPYLALETTRQWFFSERVQDLIIRAESGTARDDSKLSRYAALNVERVQLNYQKAIEEGLYKILSKMGICVLMSYIGAQIFECIGLSDQVIAKYFEGTTSKIGGLEIKDIADEALRLHRLAFPQRGGNAPGNLVQRGFLTNKAGGEFHGNNPELVKTLHEALKARHEKLPAEEQQQLFEKYTALVNERPPAALRDLLDFNSRRQPINVGMVEPAEEILRRFCTGGMSLGSLSREMHEVLAIAMNRLGGKSNSGEGGEDPRRYYPLQAVQENGTCADFGGLKDLKPGDHAGSAVRQVASARFGVTAEYLVTANQLEIKIAQGAKPGEGGQLPGHKVTDYIARLRRAKVGMPLISPPPHHDIYSIEDLSQLIFDLHQVNPDAKVSVKLVAADGIGTIAAGVAKANADIIQISGHDGGTGASPVASIKHVGTPWELGLSEVHQVLLANKLRDRVLLRVDGGLRSARDVVIAAMLGANEFGFGSIALMAAGCIMARVCHTNNCPVGITSQKESLRKRFSGSPESIVEFFQFLAEAVRHTLAQLGYRRLDEVIGRADLLVQRGKGTRPQTAQKAGRIDLSRLLTASSANRDWIALPSRPHLNGPVLDDEILVDGEVMDAIVNHGVVSRSYKICNTDRAVGSKLSGIVAKHWGDHGFKGSLRLNFEGCAGQSFGAFNLDNVNLQLIGDANDGVGKGMSGGEIVIHSTFSAEKNGVPDLASKGNVIVGNTCLYGATGGAFFAAGSAGERFAVRNSGATAVVEGAGDHCCEYMTGGTVVVLGSVGRNFGAGMTGGLAYVLDIDGSFHACFNADGEKRLQHVSRAHAPALYDIIQRHHQLTGSRRAAMVLAHWAEFVTKFWLIIPPSECAVLPHVSELLPSGESPAA